MDNTIIIYTDGASRGNGSEDSIGSWGAYLSFNSSTKKISGANKNVTNNQMELMGCIKALEVVKDSQYPIEIYTDSAYVCNGINNKWYVNWRNNGWRNAKKEAVKNKELWQELLYQLEDRGLDVEIHKVKGHSGNEGNEIADELCNIAMDEFIERE